MAGLSLRWRLAATYAGVALLTALVLGGLLLALMSASFARSDNQRLRAVAEQAAANLAATPGVDVAETVTRVAYGMNSRVQALDAGGSVVADSGPPAQIEQPQTGPAPADRRGGRQPAPTAAFVAPPNPAESRTDQQVQVAARPGSPAGIVAIRASEGPASGAKVMGQVLTAWALAAALAVAVAALIGYTLSARLTRPLTRLARVTDEMAAGDLSVRAEVTGGDELGRLGASVNYMAGRIAEQVGSMQRFASDAAHQLGTPLTALRTDLELLHDGATDPDSRRLAARALVQEERLEELGAGLLRLSRLDAATSQHVARVDLGEIVTEALDAVASRAEQAGITVTAGPDPSGIAVIGDHQQLRIAVDNLLDNAVKFSQPGGQVTAGLSNDGVRAIVFVTDDGPGIAPADRAHVFERFYRGRATADRPGTGLGLAIVARTAQTHGGSARLVDVARGTRFEMVLPLARNSKRGET